MKQMLKKAEENEKKQVVGNENLLDEPLTEENIKNAWAEIARTETQAGRKSLGMALTLHDLKISLEESVATCFVSNAAQKDWIEEKVLSRLENELRNILKNKTIKVELEVMESEGAQVHKPYTPTERANFILANNEEVRKLQKDLDLDIK